MLRTVISALAAAALVVVGLWVYYAFFAPIPGGPEQIARGRSLYDANCASCHGKNLEGQPNWRTRLPDGTLPAPPHDATGHTWHHSDQHLFDYTKKGGAAIVPAGFKSAMPGFGETLGDSEIRAILLYIKSRWPDGIRARQEGLNGR